MCIVSLAWKAHPRWKLVAIGNRDEMHDRSAQPLARWSAPDHVLAGRDEKAGGTWLGVSEQGRFAVVTNLSGHGMPDPDLASRGDLLRGFLVGDGHPAKFDRMAFADFNPFNLITIDGDEARVHSNRPEAVGKPLPSGIHGLSNGALDDPWPKSPVLDKALADWIAGEPDDPAVMLEILQDRRIYGTSSEADQIDESFEPRNLPIFIRSPRYGTRCSTVVAVDNHGAGSIIERRFDASGEVTGETRLSFVWPSD